MFELSSFQNNTKQYKKSDKASFIIYADLECIIEKIDECKNNPKTSSFTTKVSKDIPSDFSMSTVTPHLEEWKTIMMCTEVKIA